MLVVQKYLYAKQRPFARLLTGAAFPIFEPLQWIEKMRAESFGDLMVGPAAARPLEAGLKQRIEEKERTLKRQQQELKQRQQELMHLRSSTSWKVTAPLRRVGNILKCCAAWLGKVGPWRRGRRSPR